MEREFPEYGAPRRGSRILAGAVLIAAVVVATLVVLRGLDRHRVVALPLAIDVAPSLELPAGLDVRAMHGGKLLAALADAGRAGNSVVDVQAGKREGYGFVGWTEARRSYVLVPRWIVAGMIRDHQRNLVVRSRDAEYPGRLIAADRASELALVRVRGHVAPGILSASMPGKLESGRVGVTVFLTKLGRKRVEAVNLRLTPAGVLRATGQKRIPLGSPVLLLNGHPGGIVVRGGRDAVVLPLAHCRTRTSCFGPTLP